MSEPILIFAESPLNPLAIRRQRAEAGLAYEKHHFKLAHPERSPAVYLFDYEGPLLRGPAVRESAVGREIVDALGVERLPLPRLHFTLLHDARLTPGEAPPVGLVRAFLETWPGELYLAFSRMKASLPRSEVEALLEQILGQPWSGPAEPGLALLADGGARVRALSALGSGAWSELYLLANPSPLVRKRASAQWSDSNVLYPLTGSTKLVPFADFHALVSGCDWVLTTHARLPGRVPLSFYSARDLRPALRDLHGRLGPESEELVEVADLRLLPGHEEASQGELRVSSVVGDSVARTARAVSIAGSDVTDLDELRSDSDLRELDVDGIPWLDTAVVAGLTQIESLSMNGVKVDDLDFLVPLRSLRSLTLDRVPFAGLAGLGALTQIRALHLGMRRLPDLEFARSLLALEELTIDSIFAEGPALDPLSALPALRRLLLCSRSFTDLTPLSALSLTVLEISHTNVADLSPLRAMHTLQKLWVGSAKVTDLTPLNGLPSLRELNLLGADVVDATPLATLPALDWLVLEYLNLDAWEPLGALTALNMLSLSWSGIQSLGPLRGLTRLREIRLSGTAIDDLSELAHLPALETVDVSDTPVTDFAPLLHLPRLRQLRVTEGRLPPTLRDELSRRPDLVIEEAPP